MTGSTVTERMRAGGIVMDPLLVAREAKAAGIRLALACALLEQESGGGHNIFGHDRNPKTHELIFPARDGIVPVTKELYHEYLKHRKATGLCQGVGPTQLTFFALQDQADKAGGCWKADVNLRVGLQHLASLVKAGGELSGLTSYNGSVEYARTVLGLAAKWEARLAGAKLPESVPVIRLGDSGPRVRKVTYMLSYVRSRATKKPYLDGRRDRFDAEAEAALRAFQREHRLLVDGKAGTDSLRALRRAARAERRRREHAGHTVPPVPVHTTPAHPAGLPALVRDLRRLDAATGKAWDEVVAYARRRERLLERLAGGDAEEAAILKSLGQMTEILLRIEGKLGEIATAEEADVVAKTTAAIEHETAVIAETTAAIAATVAGETATVVQAETIQSPGPEAPGTTGNGHSQVAPPPRRLSELSEAELLDRVARLDRALDRSRAELISRFAKTEERLAKLRPPRRGNDGRPPVKKPTDHGKPGPDIGKEGGKSATTKVGDRGVLVRRSKIAIARYLRAKGSAEHVPLRRALRRDARGRKTGNLATGVWERGVKAVQHLAGRPVTGEMDGDLVRIILPYFPGDNAGKKIIRATPGWRLIPGQLSPNFNLKELACKDAAHTQYIAGLAHEKGLTKQQAKARAKELAKRLERLRKLGGNRPLHITSAYRTEAYNRTLKGAVPNSAHTRGFACDTPPPPGITLLQHEQHALKAFECGVGYYPGNLGNFIHSDFDSTLGGRRRWGPGRG